MANSSPRLQHWERQWQAHLQPVLLAAGFTRRRSKRLFHRPSPQGALIYQLIHLQVGGAASSQAGQYTVELAMYYPKCARRLGQKQTEPDLRFTDLEMRCRLGLLFAPPEDRWWPQLVEEQAQAEQLAEVAHALLTLGLPWLDRTDSAENAARFNTGKKPQRGGS